MLQVVDLTRGGDLPTPWARGIDPAVADTAAKICARVKGEGDEALVDLTRELDAADVEGRIALSAGELAVSARVPGDLRRAIDRMASRLRDIHRRQLPGSWEAAADGVIFGETVLPVGSAGCYVPGGRASYPSSVLMTAVPARVAGVSRVVLCTPPAGDGSISDAVVYAAGAAGVDEIYRVGGAQAVAAMAYGTETIAPVDVIVGPGNAWVTAAKREVAGSVGIDGLAGPTELVVLADESADPSTLAADVVAQAEHDSEARAVVLLLDASLVPSLQAALGDEVAGSPRRDVVEGALEGAVLATVSDERQAARISDSIAPEHLQIVTAEPRRFLGMVRSYGAAFLGPLTPVAFGDYGVGSNHVLPTMGTARFASGLRASDFVRVSAFVETSSEGLRALGPEVETVAAAEGLPGHARATAVRR